MIAAKLAGTGTSVGQVNSVSHLGTGEGANLNVMPTGVKRGFEDTAGPDTKRFLSETDSASGQVRASSDQQRNETMSSNPQVAAAAAQLAAKLNRPPGMDAVLSPGKAPQAASVSPLGSAANAALYTVTEEYKIPDRMVGLVIGKGGEQISRLQADSACRIQIAPDSAGRAERSCTLSGTQEAVEKAKHLIDDIIHNAQSAGTPECIPDGQSLIEMMIPGTKVGLVIGKGGETIRTLQDRTRCRMIMVQDSNMPSDADKPLRITGDPGSCEEARRLVQDLLDSKDLLPPGQSHGFGDFGGAGARGSSVQEMMVPKSCVGVIIGKGGDMIKRLETDFSVRIQFRQDDGSPQRCCQVTGSQENIFPALQAIQQLVDDSNRADGMGGRGMRSGGVRARPGFDGGDRSGLSVANKSRPVGVPGSQPGSQYGASGYQEAATMRVPADKCGIVIGKGGESIRDICRISGAHVELQRQPSANPGEKIFDFRGAPEQIQHAMSLIAEKAGIPMPQSFGNGGLPQGMQGSGGASMGGVGSWGAPSVAQQQQQQPWGPAGYGPAQPQQQGPSQQQAPWAGYTNYNQYTGGGGGQGDQGHEAWQAYYSQYYPPQQAPPSHHHQQQQPPQGAPQNPMLPPMGLHQAPMPMSSHAPQQQPQQQAAAPTATVNPMTGQADYSEAWAAYYRSLGYHDQAEAVLAQARAGGGGSLHPSQQH